MADIIQVCRRQDFQDLDLPPFQNNVGVGLLRKLRPPKTKT